MDKVVETLSKVCDVATEDLKVLQCILALATSTTFLHATPLAKVFFMYYVLCNSTVDVSSMQSIQICLRMLHTRESTTAAIAAATLRQIITVVFERVIKEGLFRVLRIHSLGHHISLGMGCLFFDSFLNFVFT